VSHLLFFCRLPLTSPLATKLFANSWNATTSCLSLELTRPFICCFLSSDMPAERNPRKFQSSRAYRVQARLPYGTLALAYFYFLHQLTICSRKSDIENERLPPDLFYADSEAIISQPTIPAEMAEVAPEPITSNGVAARLERKVTPGRINTSSAPTPPPLAFPPYSPTSPSPGGFKRGHSRQPSEPR
jgi:hypothetical protein